MLPPIGQSDYRRVIEQGYAWVDKSLLIKEVIDDTAGIVLLTRPRRFGKTLNLSMLHYFYAHEVDGIATTGLFDNTLLDQKHPEYLSRYQGQYPVIFITLKDIKENNYNDAYTRITNQRESLFSDLNNIEVYTLLSSQYSQYFGFTDAEVKWLLQQSQSNIDMSNLRDWYNGYQVGETIIYNPWSIVSCIKHKGEFRPYWLNTSENKLVHHLITDSTDSVKIAFEKLLQGESVEKPIIENLVFGDLHTNEQALWTMLFMSGYLKVISSEYARGSLFAQLAIPNKEVETIMVDMIF